MKIKSALFYKINNRAELLNGLADGDLSVFEFAKAAPYQDSSVGFRRWGNDEFIKQIGDKYLVMQFTIQQKRVPSDVVNKILAEKVAELESKGEVVGKKLRKEFKESIVQQLLPQAFPKDTSFMFYVDKARDIIVVLGASEAQAYVALNRLRIHLGTLSIRPIQTVTPLYHLAAHAIKNNELFVGEYGDKLRLKVGDKVVSFKGDSIPNETVVSLIDESMGVEEIQLFLPTIIEAVVTSNLTFKGIKLLALYEESEDEEASHEAMCIITFEAIGTLFDLLLKRLGGYYADI